MMKKTTSRKHLKTAFAVFVLCLSVTAFATFSIYHNQNENQRLQRKIDLTAIKNIVSDLSTSVYDPVSSLSAVISTNHFYDMDHKTEAFHRFIESKRLLETFPSVIAWSYAEVADYDTLSEAVTRINNEPKRGELGYGPIKITPKPSQGKPIAIATMVMPPAVAKKVLGYNILSNPFRRNVALEALNKGQMQISSRIELKTSAPGVILFSPVYRTKAVPETPHERRENVVGYMMAVYSTDSLFASVTDQFDNIGMDVEVHDYGPINATERPALSLSTLLSSNHMGGGKQHPLEPHHLIEVSNARDNYRDIQVAGRIWRIVVRYQDGYIGAGQNSHVFTILFFVAGLALSILSTVQVYMQLNARSILSRKVAAKTEALLDVKKELEKSRDEAELLSLTDALTGLSNRRGLQASFDTLLATTSREEKAISMAIIDVDYFKSINDNHGHDAGDAVLSSFAKLASATLKDDAKCFARLGGDEFAILFCRPKSICRTFKTAEALLDVMSKVGHLNSVPSLTASIGVAKMGVKDRSLSDLMRHADMALYEAKKKGRAQVVKYTQSLGYKQKRKDSLFSAVNTALEGDEFVPVFHPYVDIQDEKIIGFEILARWQHKTRGLLTPAAFWEALCDDGLATRISNMVMRKAFREAGELKSRGIEVGRLGINVTTQMLEDSSFANNFITYALSCGLSPDNLKIEVTERILLSRNAARISETLSQLSANGVTIAFDDFGTGFASLVHLQTFPIDCVKIDRSFIRELEVDDKSLAIVSGVVKIAHDLGFTVIAEGIETEIQRDILHDLSCDATQGFLYGKPVEITQVAKLLEGRVSAAA